MKDFPTSKPAKFKSQVKEKNSRRSQSHNGKGLVYSRIQVLWPDEKVFYPGIVKAFNPETKKHTIVYDDGDIEILNLQKQTWKRLIDEGLPQNLEANTSPPPREPIKIKENTAKRKASTLKKHNTAVSSERSKDLKTPKIKADISPTDSKSITGDDGLINVNGYKVKTSAAPILEAIFEKYGDIAARCIFSSTSVRASLLEVICNVVQRLQHHDLEAILSDLEIIENEVLDVAASKIELSWLNRHLEQLHRIVPFKEKSIELRKTKARIGIFSKAASNELKVRHLEFNLAKQCLEDAEKRLNAVNLVSRKIDDDILESESEEYFWRRGLDDLL